MALLAEEGVVKVLNLEEGQAFTFSGAEDVLKVLVDVRMFPLALNLAIVG